MGLPFKADYAKSGQSRCRGCFQNIQKDYCRLAVLESSNYHDGNTPRWYHLQCFFENQAVRTVALINGFPSLRLSDQDFIAKKIAEREARRCGKRSSSTTENIENINDLERVQSVQFYELHDQLKEHTKQKDWISILTANNQFVPRSPNEILKHTTDIIYFGAINPCSKCGKRMFIFRHNCYFCTGDLSEWVQCDNSSEAPPRSECVIPSDLKEEHSFLNRSFEVKDRIINEEYTPKKMQVVTSEMIGNRAIQTLSFGESPQVRLSIKNGSAVDPVSQLQDIAHVYCVDRLKYFAVLTKCDVKRNINSFYKIQLLESDDQQNRRFWLFRSWGRTATKIGGSKCNECQSLDEAMKSFVGLYKEKTNNDFGVEEFVKHPGLYYKLDIAYGREAEPDEIIENIENVEHESRLETSVQNLVKLIFDVDAMKKTLSEFNLDLQKMPLGKISRTVVINAMIILQEISNQIDRKEELVRLVESSNRFYTLIPHDFGARQPAIIKTAEQITSLSQHLENLLEIVDAYNLMHQNVDLTRHPVDVHYDQLDTEITPMNRSEEEFKLLEEYVANFHGETHNNFDLKIDEIFRITRLGENERYEPYKNLQNRYLLWHGSRLTNFAGILSQGLRVAPPEAPVSGYMFGKGIYFADMVSKSANYCFTSPLKPTGLMVVCEVALGNMLELNRGNAYVTPLPSGTHSVKGVGKSYPNETRVIDDGIIVPKGIPVTDLNITTELMYNEYIIYNADQVKMKYLVKMNFEYKD